MCTLKLKPHWKRLLRLTEFLGIWSSILQFYERSHKNIIFLIDAKFRMLFVQGNESPWIQNISHWLSCEDGSLALKETLFLDLADSHRGIPDFLIHRILPHGETMHFTRIKSRSRNIIAFMSKTMGNQTGGTRGCELFSSKIRRKPFLSSKITRLCFPLVAVQTYTYDMRRKIAYYIQETGKFRIHPTKKL
jgi:hypothetical protein